VKDNLSISLGNALSVIVLLLAIAGSWYSLSTRVTVLELQAKDAAEDRKIIEKLKSVILASDPASLPILGTRSHVHEFGWKPSAGVAADAAEMPKPEKPPQP